jgi:hypothetical protein
MPLTIRFTFFIATLLSVSVLAQERCGYKDGEFNDGFEAGGLPPVTLPAAGTAPALAFTFPTNGVTVNTPEISLAGTYAGPPNTGVTVAGFVASTNGQNFLSQPVRLTVGSNTITAKLTTQDGVSQTVTRSVIYDPNLVTEFSFTGTNNRTFVPYTSSFNFVQRAGSLLTPTRLRVDFDGDGLYEVDSVVSNISLQKIYDLPGLFLATAVVTFDDGNPLTPTVDITVQAAQFAMHPVYEQKVICSVYSDMKSRLVAGNIPSALNTIYLGLRPDWQARWTALGTGLASVASALGIVIDGRVSRNNTELLIGRPISGQPGQFRGFRIQFERDTDGVWRISSM